MTDECARPNTLSRPLFRVVLQTLRYLLLLSANVIPLIPFRGSFLQHSQLLWLTVCYGIAVSERAL